MNLQHHPKEVKGAFEACSQFAVDYSVAMITQDSCTNCGVRCTGSPTQEMDDDHDCPSSEESE